MAADMTEPVVIDFYFGLGSRYSYLASTQLARIEAAHACQFRWKPIASGMLIDRRGINPFRQAPVSGQYDIAYRQYDAQCWAAHYNVPFREPAGLPSDPALMALACLAADQFGLMEAYAKRLFELVFVDGITIDNARLQQLADEIGCDRSAFAEIVSAPETAQRHVALIDEAAMRGAFGVPSFHFGDQLFWGNDRLVLLESALRGIRMPSGYVTKG
jgi:2-hydroxychromene-2-carboxylate isomerase